MRTQLFIYLDMVWTTTNFFINCKIFVHDNKTCNNCVNSLRTRFHWRNNPRRVIKSVPAGWISRNNTGRNHINEKRDTKRFSWAIHNCKSIFKKIKTQKETWTIVKGYSFWNSGQSISPFSFQFLLEFFEFCLYFCVERNCKSASDRIGLCKPEASILHCDLYKSNVPGRLGQASDLLKDTQSVRWPPDQTGLEPANTMKMYLFREVVMDGQLYDKQIIFFFQQYGA